MTGLIALLLTTVFGTLITFLFNIEFQRLERLSLGIILGFGFQTFFTFIFYLFGLRFTFNNSLLELGMMIVFVSLLILIVKRRRYSLLHFINRDEIVSFLKKYPKEFRHSDLTSKFFLITIILLLGSSLVIGAFFPVNGWDSLVLYDFRAITFIATGGMADGIARGYFFGYPLMTSLAHMWMYFFKGNPHVIYWGIYFALIVIVYRSLNQFLSPFTSKITTLMLGSLLFVYSGSYFDYTNFPYLVYLILSILYLNRFTKERKPGFIVLSAILVGLSTWIRQTEPFWAINILSLPFVLIPEFRKNFLKTLALVFECFVLFFSIQQPWRLFETHYLGTGRNITDQAGFAIHSIQVFSLLRLTDVVLTTIHGTVSTWQPYLLITILISIFAWKEIRKGILYLYFILGNIGLLFFGTYIFSYIWPEDWKGIINSQQRLSTFIVLLLIIFSAVIADEYIMEGKKLFEKIYKRCTEQLFS